MEKTREKMRRLLEEGTVSGILGLRLDHSHPIPFFFAGPADLKDWFLGETNRYPLTKILLRISKKRPEAVIGIAVRGCEERSLVELFKNHQLNPEKVKPVGIVCSQDLAARCHCERPYPSEVEEGDLAKPAGDPSDAAEIESLPEEERFQYWMKMFGKCIKCYGCRNICPACFCPTCTLEDPLLIKPGGMPPEIPIFHLHKAFHMADRCIDCGLCEEVCPMGIPVRKLYRKVRNSVKEHFGYVPGEDKELKGPLEFLGDGTYELQGTGK